MKFKKIIPVFGTFFLVSCGTMTKISDDKAIEITNGIYTRQNDSQLFEDPKYLKINTKIYNKIDLKTATYGVTSSTSNISFEKYIDVENMKMRTKTTGKSNNSSTETEFFAFYDSEKNVIWNLNNKNGYKTKTEIGSYTYESAKQYFKNELTSTNYKNSSYLSSFQTHLENLKTQAKKYEAENDQYYKYSFGSNDSKSFQELIESKTKEKTSEGNLEYAGYNEYSSNLTMEKDKVTKTSTKQKRELKVENKSFYQNTEESNESTYSYDSFSISLPNVSEYEKI